MLIPRILQQEIEQHREDIPVVAIIGARQVGKSTLAKSLVAEHEKVVMLDMELSSDRSILQETAAFLELNKEKLICIDEIQMMPEVFNELRPFIDNNPDTRFIILGSSSPELMRQSSESLAGRIFYFELGPFLWQEISDTIPMQDYRLLGGMPRSVLAKNARSSFIWIRNYITTFLERDLRNFGVEIAPANIRRLWTMLAHINGQVLNYSSLARSMGLSHTSIRHYVDILSYTFMIRVLEPYHSNIRKRLIKAPKIYFRDTGILHALLRIESYDDLFSHPVFGSSWEVTVIENVLAKYKDWSCNFYRSSNGNELDLVLTKANRIIGIEIKASPSPKVSRGFWIALEDIAATESYVIAPVKMPYPLKNNAMMYPLDAFLEKSI